MTFNIDDLELSVRASNVLRKAGITSLNQFMELTKKDVMAMPHAGARTWREISDLQCYLTPLTKDEIFTRDYKTLLYHMSCVNKLLEKHPKLQPFITPSLFFAVSEAEELMEKETSRLRKLLSNGT